MMKGGLAAATSLFLHLGTLSQHAPDPVAESRRLFEKARTRAVAYFRSKDSDEPKAGK